MTLITSSYLDSEVNLIAVTDVLIYNWSSQFSIGLCESIRPPNSGKQLALWDGFYPQEPCLPSAPLLRSDGNFTARLWSMKIPHGCSETQS